LQRQFAHELLNRQIVVSGDIFEQSVEQPDLERVMIGNCDMVFSSPLSSQLDVRAGLPPRVVSQAPKRAGQFNPTAIAGYLHAASTSSRT
jgi:hypothetical protein